MFGLAERLLVSQERICSMKPVNNIYRSAEVAWKNKEEQSVFFLYRHLTVTHRIRMRLVQAFLNANDLFQSIVHPDSFSTDPDSNTELWE
jgi:hypothetical protein